MSLRNAFCYGSSCLSITLNNRPLNYESLFNSLHIFMIKQTEYMKSRALSCSSGQDLENWYLENVAQTWADAFLPKIMVNQTLNAAANFLYLRLSISRVQN
jgi:hypothetical protein